MSVRNESSADSLLGIPGPAHPERRREPLPWHEPKPAEDDPEAPNRLRAILGKATETSRSCSRETRAACASRSTA